MNYIYIYIYIYMCYYYINAHVCNVIIALKYIKKVNVKYYHLRPISFSYSYNVTLFM